MERLLITLILVCTMNNITNAQNPFYGQYHTPHEAVPFDRIETEHYEPAILEGIKLQNAEIEAIIQNPEKADFTNTIEAFEESGKLLDKVVAVFGNMLSAETNDDLQELAQKIMPLLSEHSNNITLNKKLFARVKEVYNQKETLQLTQEQKQLLENAYNSFIRHGANLEGEAREEYRRLTTELSKLTLTFSENNLKETNAYQMLLTKKGNLTPEITLKLKAEGLEKITYDATNTELKLDKVYVAVGDKVEKGELLVSFRSDSLEAKMTQYQDEIADKQLLVEHYVNLMSCDASLDYNEDIANLKRDIEVAELYVEEAEEKLSRYQITAKESGTITAMDNYLQKGGFVPGNNLITEVCGTGNYEADLPEGYEFNMGDTYTATLDALSYELKVAGVEENKIIFSPVSDMTSLSEADVLSLVITKPTLENVIYVKASAVKEGEEGHFVYLLDDSGYREAVPVTVGEKVGNHWVVTSGLSGGEKVTL